MSRKAKGNKSEAQRRLARILKNQMFFGRFSLGILLPRMFSKFVIPQIGSLVVVDT